MWSSWNIGKEQVWLAKTPMKTKFLWVFDFSLFCDLRNPSTRWCPSEFCINNTIIGLSDSLPVTESRSRKWHLSFCTSPCRLSYCRFVLMQLKLSNSCYGWWGFFSYFFIGQASSQLIVTQREGLLTWGSLDDTSIHCREERGEEAKISAFPLLFLKGRVAPTFPWQLVHIRGWGLAFAHRSPVATLPSFQVQLKCQLQPMMLSDLSSFSGFRWQLQFVP